MYRSSGSVSVLSGVLSGPYTGGKKTLHAALLEDATRTRLERALTGRGAPEPIAYDRPTRRGWLNPTWGVIAAVALISIVFAAGFGNLDSPYAEQPTWFAAIYVALAALFGACFVALLRRRAAFGAGALQPGRYLFLLDAVDISMPDANGHQTLTVRPLGDARDASVEENGRASDLVLRFEGGDTIRFPLRGDPHGEIALRRLEHVQKLLEELTYAAVLDHAFKNDLFFEIRVDQSWDKLAPGAADAPVRRPTFSVLLLGRLAPVFAAVIALAFGGGVDALRCAAGDNALYNQAYLYGSKDAMQRYLAIGGRHKIEALAHIQTLEDLEKKAIADKKEADARERAANEPQTRPGTTQQSCIETLSDYASAKHPKPTALLIHNMQNARQFGNDRTVYIEIRRHGGSMSTLWTLRAAEDAFERTFERVISDWCPLPVLRFETTPDDTRLAYWNAHLLVEYTVEEQKATWPGDVHPADFTFDVYFAGRDDKPVDQFRLHVPAPNEPPTTLRDRTIMPTPADTLSPAEKTRDLQIARAFDRLYDEVWSLFFDGDPVVPLKHASAVLTP